MKLSFIALASIFLFSSPRLPALDDWQPITAEELKMTIDPSHTADAIILYHEETSDDNRHHRYMYKRLKVLTDKGKDRGNVELPYDAGQVHIIDIKARTIAPDGTITPFTGKAFDSTIIKGQGVKYLAKTFTLPNVQTGSIIEWKYTEYWDEDLVYAPHWTVQEELAQKRAKFTFVPLRGSRSVQDSRGNIKDRVYYSLIGLPPNTTIKETPDNKMELELHDLPAFEEEDFAPPPRILKMRVNFYYGSDKMSKPQDFWKGEGKYWSKDAEKFMGDSSAVAAAVNQIVGPSDTPDQKVRKIYEHVQKMKNLNYDREEGAIEEQLAKDAKERRTIGDALRKNEGYRDELVQLFVAMVRAVKVPAYLMRVSDRDEIFFQATVPMFSQLTSEIAIVSMADGKEVYLDPGTRFCPFGLLAWQHNGTQGIRQIAGGGTDLAPTPGANYKDTVSKRVGRLSISADGSARGRVVLAWTGEEALVHRLSGFKTDEAGRKKELENELKGMLPSGAIVQLESATGWDAPEAQLQASFTVEVPSFASSAGRRMMVPTNLFESNSRQPFAHGERKTPVYFNYPFYTMDDVQISFPSTFRVENVPQPQHVKTDYSVYKMEHVVNANTLSISRDFGIAGMIFTQQDYAGLRKFFSGVTTGDSEQIVLTAAQ